MTQISMRLRITTLAVLFTFCSMMMATSTGAVAQAPTKHTQHMDAYVQWADGNGNTLTGVITISSFAKQANQLVASGILNGTVTNSAGLATPITTPVTLPVSSVDPSCNILNLVLGPLDLNLLGLQIHLSQIVLNVTAVSGAGNLLGNLLCAVANLLNGGTITGVLDQLVALLNQILTAL